MLCALLLGHADAEEPNARGLFQAGVAAAARHEWQAAIGLFERSYAARPLPEVLFNVALCERALGHPAAAIRALRRYAGAAAADGKPLVGEGEHELQRLMRELEPKVGVVQIDAPPGTPLSIDGAAIDPAPTRRELDPGPYVVEALTPGLAPSRVELHLGAGVVEHVRFAPATAEPARAAPTAEPAAAPTAAPPSASRPAATADAAPRPRFLATAQGRAALGLAVASAALFIGSIATGGVVLSEKSRYQASCQDICDAALYTHARHLAIATDTMLSVGGAAALTSLVLLLARPKPRAFSFLVDPRGRALAVQGEF
jgi:hypothetical protein